MPREMGYVSDYEEFRRSDERDTELREEMRRERAEEMGHPYPPTSPAPAAPPVVATPYAAGMGPNVWYDDCEICGEPRRRCECWL